MSTPFSITRRVQFSETDMAGIMHFSNFFKMMEEVEHAFFRSVGLSVSMQHDDIHIGWPRVSASCEFLGPVKFEDEVELKMRVVRVGDKSFSYEVEFLVNGSRVALGKTTSVCCDVGSDDMLSINIPPAIREKLGEGSANNMLARPLLLIALLSSWSFAEEWSQWRGPRGDGTSLETDIPTHWSASENIHWKTPIPGKGHSSPIVFGDRIFLTSCLELQQQRLLLCLDRASGRILWQREVVRAALEQKHTLNSYASATPVTDGKHVWVAFFDIPRIELICYDLEGTEVWRRSPGEFHSVHGFCSSPILYKNLVIFNCDQDAPASVVAMDKETGAEIWRADRPNRTRSYCTPLIRSLAGKEQLMLSGSKCVASYDANTGRQLWLVDGPTEQFVAGLVESDGIVFVTGGFPTFHLLAIDPTGHGNVTHNKVLWHDHRGASYVPSPIAAGHYFFVVSDDGIASCWEAASGKMLWKHRLGAHQSGSGVSADGNIYFTADDGETFVFKASPKFELVSSNPLGDECRASPAISHGQLFIRTLHELFCIGPRG